MWSDRNNNKMWWIPCSSDKMNNPLITIPGLPGIGKSLYLANFTLTPQFKEYVQDRAAIISMLTKYVDRCTRAAAPFGSWACTTQQCLLNGKPSYIATYFTYQ